MKTLNDTMFAKALAHAAKMLETEEATWNQENPVSQMFGGWNGEVMCPVNRAAFILTYGVEATIKITAAALKAIEEKQNRKANSQYAQHLAAAKDAVHADVFEIHEGDFMLCEDIGLKFDHENLHLHIRHFVEGAKMDAGEIENDMDDFKDYKHVNERLVKIIRIEDHLEGFFDDTAHCLRNWKAQSKGEGYEGGSCTDDYGEDLNIYNLSNDEQKEVFSTFYTLGVLVRDPSGKFVIIDPEGYEYPRYVLFRQDWRTMWAKDVTEAEREIAEAASPTRTAPRATRCARSSTSSRGPSGTTTGGSPSHS